jgi:hypothetical protein
MTSKAIRGVALTAVLVGAVSSVVFLLRAAQHPGTLVLVLLALWGLSPFAALVLADRISKRWPVLGRGIIHGLTLVITLGYLLMYGDGDLRPAGKPPAFVFVMVPLLSWLLIAIAVPIAALISRSRPR